MHLIIPFAHINTEACTQALQGLHLPHLNAMVQNWMQGPHDEGSDETPTTPHERALARAWGWHGVTGALPFAAQAAKADGIDTCDLAWGLLTPSHWHVGRDHITQLDPAQLNLSDDESRGLFNAVRPLFETEGMVVAYGAPLRWYVAHDSLDGLACASLDRVLGRHVDAWLPSGPAARLIRRLQSEVQILLYSNLLNEAREARGEHGVNSFWLSGCGRYQNTSTAESVQVIQTLRTPALQQDWSAWTRAWQHVDAEILAPLQGRSNLLETITVTLCGEQSSQSLIARPSSIFRRISSALSSAWRPPSAYPLLKAL